MQDLQKTFNKWIKIKNFSNSIFDKISIAYPQNFETKYYLKKLGVNKINFIGNLKFTENNDTYFSKFNKKLKNEFNKRNIWVASST